jgi:hypothetical protein
VNVEILIGRALACCVHPAAAWPRLAPVKRALLVGAYAAGGYITVLAALLIA